eukprot:14986_1
MKLLFAVLLLFDVIDVSIGYIGGVPEPSEYILSFPRGPNPLNITVDPSPEKNYMIILGDWGCAGQDTVGVKMQIGVANKMKSFIASQKSLGMNLLFIGTVGDNFYPAGQSCTDWQFAWNDKYGDLANDYIWLASKGNHDWANLDPAAMCPWNNPKYIDPDTKMPYAANQINADKGGCNPDNYYLPDFGYYYNIPQLNFEWIVLEETVLDCGPGDAGFYTFNGCGNNENDHNGTIGCAFLGKMRDSTENMMRSRANTSNNTNFLIVEHYEAETQTMLLNEFNNAVSDKNKEYIVWSLAGHAHIQQCIHYNNKNQCDTILTGGGGTGSTNDLHGFFVIGFDENKNMIQPYKITDPQISCNFTIPGECGQNFTKQEIMQNNIYKCQ